MAKPHGYHLLDLAGKQRVQLERQWRPPVERCTACGVQVLSEQLEDHERMRCNGEPLVRR